MLLLTIISFAVCYFCVHAINRQHYEQISYAAADFTEILIDADDAKDFLTTRKVNESYEETLQKLEKYRENSENIRRISLVSFSNSVGYYIYDTDSTQGQSLGKKLNYDSYTSSVKSELINGRNEWQQKTGQCIYTYRPIRTIDDKLAGYIIIETSIADRRLYFIALGVSLILVLLLSGGCCLLLTHFINKEVFQPIRSFSKTALEFTGSVSSSGDMNLSDLFKTNKDNEIGHLGNAIKKMISDINNSTENLSNAIYEATHDGMTQVYNKRHYNNMYSNFKKCASLCVIYFDVNNLKLMNDTQGHDRGDYVIKQAAEYIRNFTGESALCFRMGGDEFLLILSECSFRDMDQVIEQLEQDSPILLSAESDVVTCALSYGYAYAKGSFSYEQLLAEAEENMYKKKAELKEKLHMPDR